MPNLKLFGAKIDELYEQFEQDFSDYYREQQSNGRDQRELSIKAGASFRMLIAANALANDPAYENLEQLPEGMDIQKEIAKRQSELEADHAFREAAYGILDDMVCSPKEEWEYEDEPEVLPVDTIMENFSAKMNMKQTALDQVKQEYKIGASATGPNLPLFRRRLEIESKSLDGQIEKLAGGAPLSEEDMDALGSSFTSWMGYVEAANDPQYANLKVPPKGQRLDDLRQSTETFQFRNNPAYKEMFKPGREKDVLDMICGPRSQWKDGKPARLSYDEMKKNLGERVKAIEEERKRAEAEKARRAEKEAARKAEKEKARRVEEEAARKAEKEKAPAGQENTKSEMDRVHKQLFDKIEKLGDPIYDASGNVSLASGIRMLLLQYNSSNEPEKVFKEGVRGTRKFLAEKLPNSDKTIAAFAREKNLLGDDFEKLMNRAEEIAGIDRQADLEEELGLEPQKSKTAAKWIDGFKKAFREHPGQVREQAGYPASYIARIMAARELSNSTRGKASTLNKELGQQQIEKRAREMMANKNFKEFAETLSKAGYLDKVEAIFTKTHSHGGELDDLFRDHLTMRPAGKMPNDDPTIARWMPTVKQRVEYLQKKAAEALKNNKDVYKEASEITLLRRAAGVQRGGKGLNNRVPIVGDNCELDLSKAVESNAESASFKKAFEKANGKKLILSGHGGEMMKKMTGQPQEKELKPAEPAAGNNNLYAKA